MFSQEIERLTEQLEKARMHGNNDDEIDRLKRRSLEN